MLRFLTDFYSTVVIVSININLLFVFMFSFGFTVFLGCLIPNTFHCIMIMYDISLDIQ